MQLQNIILKSAVVITLLLHISSFVSTQEALDLMNEGIEALDEFQKLANLTENDNSLSKVNGTSGADKNLTLSNEASSLEAGSGEATTDSRETSPTEDSSSVTDSPVTDPTEESSSVTDSRETDPTEETSSVTSVSVTGETNITTQNITVVTEESNSTSTDDPLSTTDAMITETSTQIVTVPGGDTSSSRRPIIATTTIQSGNSNAEEAKVRPWAIATITVLISFAMIFTVLYFLRGYLIKKRRMDQRRLLGSRVSQEGFFFGESGDGFREL